MSWSRKTDRAERGKLEASGEPPGPRGMMRDRLNFLFLNLGHFFDHFFILVIATVVLALGPQWGLAYDELIPYATPCFVMFGLGAVPSGWLADKWSREGMMLVFFLGIGATRSEEHTSELQSLMRISYADFC